MATIFPRKNAAGEERHTCRVRLKGVVIARTFRLKGQAESWGKRVEAAIEDGRWPVRELLPEKDWPHYFPDEVLAADEPEAAIDPDMMDAPSPAWTLRRAIDRFVDDIQHSMNKPKSLDDMLSRLRMWQTRPAADMRLSDIDGHVINAHVDSRLREGRKSNTIRNECFLISALYTHASQPTSKRGWGLTGLRNPVGEADLPKPPEPRQRRLQTDVAGVSEEIKLRDAIRNGRDAEEMMALFEVAIETAMRLSEILERSVRDLCSVEGRWQFLIPDTKNGHYRNVYLSTRAVSALLQLPSVKSAEHGHRIFSLDIGTFENRWTAARKKAGVSGLRWHDLRREGLSRMATKGLGLDALMSQSGHSSVQTVAIYLRTSPEEIVRKLG